MTTPPPAPTRRRPSGPFIGALVSLGSTILIPASFMHSPEEVVAVMLILPAAGAMIGALIVWEGKRRRP